MEKTGDPFEGWSRLMLLPYWFRLPTSANQQELKDFGESLDFLDNHLTNLLTKEWSHESLKTEIEDYKSVGEDANVSISFKLAGALQRLALNGELQNYEPAKELYHSLLDHSNINVRKMFLRWHYPSSAYFGADFFKKFVQTAKHENYIMSKNIFGETIASGIILSLVATPVLQNNDKLDLANYFLDELGKKLSQDTLRLIRRHLGIWSSKSDIDISTLLKRIDNMEKTITERSQ